MMSEVAIILPVHNEAWLIGSVLGQVTDFACTHPDWRFIFVDDGSSDETPTRIEEHIAALQAKFDEVNLELIRLSPNVGKATAIRTAVLDAPEEIVCFTDGDLAYPLEHLDTLVATLANSDVVIGSRALANAPQGNITTARRVVGTTFNMVVRAVTGLPFHDTQAGLKGFRHEAAQLLFREQVVDDFAFDAELLFLAKRLGMKIKEIPANVSQRHSYKKSRVNMFRDPLRMFYSLVRMRYVHRGIRRRIPPFEPQASQRTLANATIEPREPTPVREKAHASSDA